MLLQPDWQTPFTHVSPCAQSLLLMQAGGLQVGSFGLHIEHWPLTQLSPCGQSASEKQLGWLQVGSIIGSQLLTISQAPLTQTSPVTQSMSVWHWTLQFMLGSFGSQSGAHMPFSQAWFTGQSALLMQPCGWQVGSFIEQFGRQTPFAQTSFIPQSASLLHPPPQVGSFMLLQLASQAPFTHSWFGGQSAFEKQPWPTPTQAPLRHSWPIPQSLSILHAVVQTPPPAQTPLFGQSESDMHATGCCEPIGTSELLQPGARTTARPSVVTAATMRPKKIERAFMS
jgi:hypothetical protein